MENVNTNDIVEGCMGAIQSKIKNLKKLNIIVIGKSGVGKSTLVNAVFRDQMAETGIGKPVTQCMRKYTKQDVPLCIFDTKGLELVKDTQAEVKEDILQLIRERRKSGDINEAIHCIWYCISTVSNRIEEAEIAWLKEFTEESSEYQVPVIIILTQTIFDENANKMAEEIEKADLDVVKIIPVLAQDYWTNKSCIPAHGLGKIIDVMEEVLPEELIDSLANVQKVSMKLKKKRAQAVIAGAVALAIAAAASPIPVSDAAALVSIEVTMLGSITAIFGLEFNKALLTTLVSSITGAAGATIVGKTIFANLIKLVPGAGSIVGGLISAGTAAAVTTALGEAYIGVMVAIYNGEMKMSDLETERGRAEFKRFFTEELHNYKQKR